MASDLKDIEQLLTDARALLDVVKEATAGLGATIDTVLRTVQKEGDEDEH